MNRLLGLLALLSSLSACIGLQVPPAPSTADLPAADVPAPENLAEWWKSFNDPALTTLIDEALAHNLDLKLAALRVREAKALARLAATARFPRLDMHIGGFRNRASEIGANPLPPGFTSYSTAYQLNVDFGYEIDIWGRIEAQVQAARSDLEAATALAYGARASLAATLARAYFQLRSLDAERALTMRTLASYKETALLIERRMRAGISNELEFKAAQVERFATQARFAALDQAIAEAESAIAVLAGRTPRAVFTPEVRRDAELVTLTPAPVVPAGLDAQLLERRLDVIEAAQRLLGAEWRWREARAAILPRLSLTGFAGYESGMLSELISSPARVGQIAAALLQPLTGIATLSIAKEAAAARREQAVLVYESTVRKVFREVHDALVAVRQSSAVETAQNARLDSAEAAEQAVQLRFDGGYSNYLEVLDAKRQRYVSAAAALAARRDRLLAGVNLYLALGGGWVPPHAQ